MEGKSWMTRNIIHELHSSDIQRDHIEVKVLFIEVSLKNFILLIYKEIKGEVKMVFLEVPLMNFILWISNDIH